MRSLRHAILWASVLLLGCGPAEDVPTGYVRYRVSPWEGNYDEPPAPIDACKLVPGGQVALVRVLDERAIPHDGTCTSRYGSDVIEFTAEVITSLDGSSLPEALTYIARDRKFNIGENPFRVVTLRASRGEWFALHRFAVDDSDVVNGNYRFDLPPTIEGLEAELTQTRAGLPGSCPGAAPGISDEDIELLMFGPNIALCGR